MQPELVIFDCDGVLIDSEVLACRVLAETLQAEYGIALTPQEALDRYLGLSSESETADLEARYNIKITPAYIENKKQRRLRAFEKDLQPIAGVVALLDHLGVACCVASSSSPERLEHSLGVAGLWDRLKPQIFSATQVANGKPAPDLFLFAAKKMSVAPADCVVVEDSPAGVTAARAAGMKVYGFTGGSHCDAAHAEKLLQAGANKIMTSMRELAMELPFTTMAESSHGA